MEIILISADKLKITLSKSDLEDFGLDANTLDYGVAETKRMLWDILSRAKHRVGFDPDNKRVLVQLYPAKDGSCEMFVTATNINEGSIYDNIASEYLEDIDDPEGYGPQPEVKILELESLSALTDLCRRLKGLDLISNSEVYIFEGKFYLIIFYTSQKFYSPLDELSLIGEYGTPRRSPDMLLNIYEFGKNICGGDAINKFSEL
jgi:negative regulator of genetic competence, sporulation and motility